MSKIKHRQGTCRENTAYDCCTASMPERTTLSEISPVGVCQRAGGLHLLHYALPGTLRAPVSLWQSI